MTENIHPNTIYKVETTDEYTAKALIQAHSMRVSIEGLYNDVFREFFKHRNLTDEQSVILDEIWEKTREHFEEFMI